MSDGLRYSADQQHLVPQNVDAQSTATQSMARPDRMLQEGVLLPLALAAVPEVQLCSLHGLPMHMRQH